MIRQLQQLITRTMLTSKVKSMEIWGSQVCDYTYRCFLECNVTCSNSYLPNFRMKYLPPYSGHITEFWERGFVRRVNKYL